ncbi:MAG: hypothetical protein GY930_04795 [bacterium]|nr:hypothetical protein [bacterium]
MTDALNGLRESSGEGGEFGSAEQSMEMTGSGELHWNLIAGRLAKLTLELQRDMDSTAEWSVEAHGTEMEVSYEGEQSSTFQIELTEEQSDIEE